MTAEEMDTRKLNIIRFLLKEDLTEERLQHFECIRKIQEQYRQQIARLRKEDNVSSRLSRLEEPTAEYILSQSTATETRIKEFINYLLNEVPEDEDLFEFELLCNNRELPCRFTREKLIARAEKAEAEFARGEGIPHEEVGKIIESWK